AGRYPIPPLGVELGIWKGRYQNQELPWLRWWDAQGQLLWTSEERVAQEREAKERAQQQALAEQRRAMREREAKEQVQRRTARLVAQLRALGIEPHPD
ncbi:MAG: Uma2 family endonuclease, partial [Anaerolineales bacterium]